MNQSAIEQFLAPTKTRDKNLDLFFATVISISGNDVVVQPRSGGTIYAKLFTYASVGDLVACLSKGTTIIAFATQSNGILPIANGGTGANNKNTAALNLGFTAGDTLTYASIECIMRISYKNSLGFVVPVAKQIKASSVTAAISGTLQFRQEGKRLTRDSTDIKSISAFGKSQNAVGVGLVLNTELASFNTNSVTAVSIPTLKLTFS